MLHPTKTLPSKLHTAKPALCSVAQNILEGFDFFCIYGIINGQKVTQNVCFLQLLNARLSRCNNNPPTCSSAQRLAERGVDDVNSA